MRASSSLQSRLPKTKMGMLCLALLMTLAGPAQARPEVSGRPSFGWADAETVAALRVQTPAYTLDARGLAVPGYASNDAPGAPILPVWGAVVELPPSGRWSVSVEPGVPELVPLSMSLPAAPVPQPILAGASGWDDMGPPSAAPVVDRPDPAIYGADAFYPAEVVQPAGVQWQRGRRLLALRVFPFQYNPAAGVLRYYADVKITVHAVRDASAQPAGLSMTFPLPADHGSTGSAPRDVLAHTASGSTIAGAARAGTSAAAGRLQGESGVLRIRTAGRGMIRLTYEALVGAAPAIAEADPATFAVTYLKEAVDVRLIQAEEGKFNPGDSLIFHAEPYRGRYQTHNVYWFTWGGTGSPPMATRVVTPDPAAEVVTEITRTLHLENDRIYVSAIGRPRDADHWFDSQVGPLYAPISYTLALSDTVLTGDLLLTGLINSGVSQSTEDRSVSLRLNDHGVGAYAWSGLVDHVITATVPASWLDAEPDKLGIWAGVGNVYPDWFEVTYPSQARAYSDTLYIESIAPGANENVVAGFSSPQVMVYDLRDSTHPVMIAAPPAQPDGDAYTLHFWDEDLPGPTYFLSTDAALVEPLAIEAPVQDGIPAVLASPDNRADYIAIVHRDLWDAIDPLLAHRSSSDGLTVAKVDVQQVYDEFSYGRRDPEAIRSFLAYAYQYWKGRAGDAPAPQYVVLVGDGHYDFTGVSGTDLPNLIPPYLLNIDPWMGETAADNRFVSVDPPVDGQEDFLPDMAIGRIPAQTTDDVAAVVDKILAYENAAAGGDWQRRAVFAADNCADSAGDFHWLSDQARLDALPATFENRTVYYGDLTSCPESDYSTASGMQTGIRAGFDGGALMLQWFGHAGTKRWGTAAEFPPGQLPIYVFSSNVPQSLNANTTWPVTFAYTCYSGYYVGITKSWYVNYMDETVAEALVLAPARGSVADVSPSGLHVGGALTTLNRGMLEAIFLERADRMGLAVDLGKLYYFAHAGSFFDVIDTSILFGDPATRLRLPPTAGIARHESVATAATLSWQHVPQYASYQVWRHTQPYFDPDDSGAELRGTVPAPAPSIEWVTYDDEGAIGNVTLNYYYVVRGVTAAGVSGDSNRVGEFDFAIAAGG